MFLVGMLAYFNQPLTKSVIANGDSSPRVTCDLYTYATYYEDIAQVLIYRL